MLKPFPFMTKTKFRYSGMKLFSHIFPIFLLALRLPGIIADLDTLILFQALIMLPVYKLEVLGDGGVGKTALISRFRSKTFAEEVSASGYFTIKECELTYCKV